VLAVVGFALALLLPRPFVIVAAIYFALTLAYSLWLKRLALADVVTLAGLYTLRVIAGIAAIGVTASFWLLAFSIFTFFSLAMVKRCTELSMREQRGEQDAVVDVESRT
jgi:4-hydroxybenzoate polyprenyltransferase